MKLFLQGTAILALLIGNTSAARSGIFAANGVELEVYQFGDDTIIGEPVHCQLTLIVKNDNFVNVSI
ncbi:unnamed protein product [Penicillium glandicola]